MSDFNANDDYHIKMRQISRRTFIPVEKAKKQNSGFMNEQEANIWLN